ncbi:MAG: DUF2336 domain-containing protein [Hyphomicrobiales bacterium]|nr:DUF2336 domain-containing protein [Hyphomicrobiales bacterium]
MFLNNEYEAFQAAEALKNLVPFMKAESLIDLVAVGNEFCHLALASSPSLSAPVACALSDRGTRDVRLVLILNKDISIPVASLIHILSQSHADAEVMLALEERNEPDMLLWKALLSARLHWIAARSEKEMAHETRVITLLWSSPLPVRRHYMNALMAIKQITPQLLFSAFRAGAREIAVALLAKASALPSQAIDHALTTQNPDLIRSIARKAGLADILADDLIDAIDVMADHIRSYHKMAA